jgi:hypothetical protein
MGTVVVAPGRSGPSSVVLVTAGGEEGVEVVTVVVVSVGTVPAGGTVVAGSEGFGVSIGTITAEGEDWTNVAGPVLIVVCTGGSAGRLARAVLARPGLREVGETPAPMFIPGGTAS